MFEFIKKALSGSNEAEIKRLRKTVEQIGALEGQMQKLSDEEMRAYTGKLRERAKGGEDLDKLLPEAYALVREAAVRALGQRPFDTQMIGAIVLHQGRIAEMRTGEGKTLTAALPAFLNALPGEGVHIVTVNEYLARFHSEWMGKVYRFLGLTVGLIEHDMDAPARQAAYACDITYGTNNEFGFDYLRDNMVTYKERMVQRPLNFAIVDEVDSILIDEARTPLIISGRGDKPTEMYGRANQFVQRLREGEENDYVREEKEKTITLTEEGVRKAETFFGVDNLTDPENQELYHYILAALRANVLMKRDVDYVVKDGQVIIVDEFTGRLMIGRRYSDGLHQAIEAKEGVKVERENRTLATITFQNYFRMYKKLSGMTGTAKTEEEEFRGIYKLDVVTIPTNKPMIRKDLNDAVFVTQKAKFAAIIEEIVKRHATGQPVLVGTVSVEKSEFVSKLLEKRGVPHVVLNAKFHEKEAEIVAQAGKKGAVTIATNMAGRGTDILLGGNAEFMARKQMRQAGYADEVIEEAIGFNENVPEEVLEARKVFRELLKKFSVETEKGHEEVIKLGGLHIIGTERHESRRIDNQLRGRAGRQGDPGESRFYLSLEDDIMRLFGSERVMGMMEKLGVDEDTPIDAKILSNAIENAQKQVESRNFQTRKTVLEYDDVMNTQRQVIYEQRRKVLDGENLKDSIQTMLTGVITNEVNAHMGELKHMDAENWREVCAQYRGLFLRPDEFKFTDKELEQYSADELIGLLQERASDIYARKEKELGEPLMRELERVMMLRVVDEYWMDQIDAMQDLRQGIGLRAYGQNDPKVEYKREGYEMFERMIAAIQEETLRRIFLARIQVGSEVKRERVAKVTGESAGGDGTVKKQPVKKGQKIGPNEPCPCGSGKKFKKCTCKEYHPDL